MTGQPEQETITHLAAQVAALRGQVRLINGRLDRAGLKELSTLAAEWHRTYSRPPPDLARALEFYDRWLPKHHAPGRSYSARVTSGVVVADQAGVAGVLLAG